MNIDIVLILLLSTMCFSIFALFTYCKDLEERLLKVEKILRQDSKRRSPKSAK